MFGNLSKIPSKTILEAAMVVSNKKPTQAPRWYFAINSAAAGTAAASRTYGSYSLAADVVLAAFVLMTFLVNVIAVTGLYVGRQTRGKLISGLIAMYTDNQVDKYYDKSLVSNYGTRYLLFGAVIILLALTAIGVPLVVRLL